MKVAFLNILCVSPYWQDWSCRAGSTIMLPTDRTSLSSTLHSGPRLARRPIFLLQKLKWKAFDWASVQSEREGERERNVVFLDAGILKHSSQTLGACRDPPSGPCCQTNKLSGENCVEIRSVSKSHRSRFEIFWCFWICPERIVSRSEVFPIPTGHNLRSFGVF